MSDTKYQHSPMPTYLGPPDPAANNPSTLGHWSVATVGGTPDPMSAVNESNETRSTESKGVAQEKP